jgi:enamine deaminase RidA (YjgF/YER057c/UK114 family)
MKPSIIAAALSLPVCGHAAAAEPEIVFLNPPGLFQPGTFSQLAIAGQGKMVLISGQTARDAQGNIVGKGDLRAQTVQVFENLEVALQSVGGTFANVLKLTTFVVDLKPDDRLMIAEILGKYFPPDRRPAHTLIGIDVLAVEDLLIEIEATAVVAD